MENDHRHLNIIYILLYLLYYSDTRITGCPDIDASKARMACTGHSKSGLKLIGYQSIL